MFATIDNATLDEVTGGLARGASPTMMLMMVGLMMSRMGGIDNDRRMKMFDVFKGMLEKRLPGKSAGKTEEKKDDKKDDKK